jgi:hypothetical protein
MRDAPIGFIDPPTPFSPKAEWQEFLGEMEALSREHPGSKDIEDAIAQAKAALSA